MAREAEATAQLDLGKVLADLYASEINCGLASFWDAGWHVWIGDVANGYAAECPEVETVAEAAQWLHDNAIRLYPRSLYARKARSC